MARRRSPLVWLMPLGTLAQFMLPRWVATRIARVAGLLAFRYNHRQRNRLLTNFRHVLGPAATDEQVRATARAAFVNLVTNYVDLLRIPVLRRRIPSLVGGDHSPLARALERGNGAVVVTAHVGNWDLAGAYIGALGYPISAVFEPVPAGWAKTFNRYRSATGLDAIPIPDREAIGRALSEGRVLALVSDRDLTGRGILCPAFDAQRSFPRGPAAYSLRHDAPLIVGFVVFDGRRGRPPYRVHVDPPLDYAPRGDFETDVRELTRLLARRINEFIAGHPDQWLTFKADWR